jgi:hypothetical protein
LRNLPRFSCPAAKTPDSPSAALGGELSLDSGPVRQGRPAYGRGQLLAVARRARASIVRALQARLLPGAHGGRRGAKRVASSGPHTPLGAWGATTLAPQTVTGATTFRAHGVLCAAPVPDRIFVAGNGGLSVSRPPSHLAGLGRQPASPSLESRSPRRAARPPS